MLGLIWKNHLSEARELQLPIKGHTRNPESCLLDHTLELGHDICKHKFISTNKAMTMVGQFKHFLHMIPNSGRKMTRSLKKIFESTCVKL